MAAGEPLARHLLPHSGANLSLIPGYLLLVGLFPRITGHSASNTGSRPRARMEKKRSVVPEVGKLVQSIGSDTIDLAGLLYLTQLLCTQRSFPQTLPFPTHSFPVNDDYWNFSAWISRSSHRCSRHRSLLVVDEALPSPVVPLIAPPSRLRILQAHTHPSRLSPPSHVLSSSPSPRHPLWHVHNGSSKQRWPGRAGSKQDHSSARLGRPRPAAVAGAV